MVELVKGSPYRQVACLQNDQQLVQQKITYPHLVSFKCPLFMEITGPSSTLTFGRYLRFWWFVGSKRVLYECSSDWHLAGFREMTHSLLGLLNQNWRWFKCVEPWGVSDWLFDTSWVSGFGSRPWNFAGHFGLESRDTHIKMNFAILVPFGLLLHSFQHRQLIIIFNPQKQI